ncbi:MAG: methionine--tRNA ligase subunit beta [Desulfurococcales archaeon]|nr:methionine--tRNA ligase subunit beta [Desulfurococcales archaeon]
MSKKPEVIELEDFAKIDLRVGRVVEAEKLPGSKKLLRVVVDLGSEKRQVLAGLAKWYKPEDLLGKYVVVVANLKPKKMAGSVSEGMILAAVCSGVPKPVLLTVMEPVEPGSDVC